MTSEATLLGSLFLKIMDTKRFNNPNYLREEQYKDSRNLDARAELHRRFTQVQMPWHAWIFDHLDLHVGESILECGCGPGWLWRENVDRIPDGCTLTLTDFSAGMVAEAEAALADSQADFVFRQANVMELPFDDGRFDVVVANHMLYHVPDIDQGLREIQRVLKPNGRCYAATNGNNHMQELRALASQFVPDYPAVWQLGFRLENGRSLFEPYFSDIELIRYDSQLVVTESQPLIDYVYSMASLELPTETRAAFEKHVHDEVNPDNPFIITKDTGLFTARKQ